jgi:hypothetical protein
MNLSVLIVGHLSMGVRIVGVFRSEREAYDYGDQNLDEPWDCIRLDPPYYRP